MGVFTKLEDPLIDNIVSAHLEEIVNNIVDRYSNITSIYLTGGFGRGEGTVRKSEESWCPQNDYDIIVVSDLPDTNPPEREALSRKLARRFNLPFVDIGWVSESQLSELKLTMHNYDFRYGSKLIYGKEIRDRVPPFIEGVMPLFEFFRLINNRTAGLLTTLLPHRIKDENYRQIQLIKAFIATGDAFVALNGYYCHLYSERWSHFEKLKRELVSTRQLSQNIVDRISESYAIKLGVANGPLNNVPVSALRFMLSNAYCKLAEKIDGGSYATLAEAECHLLHVFGARVKKSLRRRVSSLMRRDFYGFLGIRNIALHILFAQVPMYVAGTTVMSARLSYMKRFWWLPHAFKYSLNGIGAVKLWEEFVHQPASDQKK